MDQWLERLDEEPEGELLGLAKERALECAKRQRIITQAVLESLVEQREAIEDHRARKEELWAEMMAYMEVEYAFYRRFVEAALEAGAEVERGEYTLEDALPQERQMELPLWGPRLVYTAAG